MLPASIPTTFLATDPAQKNLNNYKPATYSLKDYPFTTDSKGKLNIPIPLTQPYAVLLETDYYAIDGYYKGKMLNCDDSLPLQLKLYDNDLPFTIYWYYNEPRGPGDVEVQFFNPPSNTTSTYKTLEGGLQSNFGTNQVNYVQIDRSRNINVTQVTIPISK
jgi:hypothetical protein